MTFEDHAVDESGMTGGKRRRNAASALKGRSVLIVDHPDGPVELRPHLGGPLLAAAAAWVAMHHDRSCRAGRRCRSEEHTSELQSLMRISYAVFCLKNKQQTTRPP